jgi:hypothetical protein
MTLDEEAHLIAGILSSKVEPEWDGRESILEMKAAGSHHWRQMEWIGFYFEFKARQVLQVALGGSIGPTYGRVTFDYTLQHVWDFKAHPTNGPVGHQPQSWAYMNDSEAVDACIREHGAIGWLIACGRATYDVWRQFKVWHDTMKGEQTDYVKDNVNRGARERPRKTHFLFDDLVVVVLGSPKEVEDAMAAGWLRNDMQMGQRNSNGRPRRSKYGVNVAMYLARGGLHHQVGGAQS